MMALKLKACDICGAITRKDDEGFHLRWHAELVDDLRKLNAVLVQYTDVPEAADALDGDAKGGA